MSGVLQKDDNGYPVSGGVSSSDDSVVLPLKIDPITGRLLMDAAGLTPGGADTDVQFNDGGILGGNSGFTYNKTDLYIKVGGGTPTFTVDGTASIYTVKNVSGYYIAVAGQNLSSGTSASTDTVLSNDIGTDTTNYFDWGINSSTYNDAAYTITGAGDGYLYNQSQNLAIGTAAAGKQLVFFTGGTLAANERVRITDSGLTIGLTGTTTGQLTLKGSTSGTVNIKTANAAGTYTLTLPVDDGDASQFLQTDGSGVLSWATASAGGLTVGTTTIASGTTTRILYDNAGVLGEYSVIPVALGGTNATSQTTNGVAYFNGTSLTTGSTFVFDGTNVGIGTTTPGSQIELYGTGQLTSALTNAGVRSCTLALNSSTTSAGAGGAITFGNIQSNSAGSIGFTAIKGLLINGSGNTTGDLAFSTRNATGDTALSERLRIIAAGNVGIGTSTPDRLLHEEVSDAVSSAVVFGQRHSHITSGTAAVGFGIGEEYELENASGTNRVVATSSYAFTDATNASEDASWTLQLMRAGTLATALSVDSLGALTADGVAVPTISSTSTITNKRNQPRTASSTTDSNLSPNLSTANVYFRTTQTATLTIGAPTGTPVIGEVITIYVDSAGAQTLTINSTYKVFGSAFPATTTAGKTFMMTAMYNGTDWKSTWANAI